MNEQEAIALLVQNIQYSLRHPNYDRALKIRARARMVTLGEGQEEEALKFRRYEKSDLKEQRKRLHISETPAILSRPRKYWKRIGRVEGIRRNFVTEERYAARLVEFDQQAYNFMPGESLEQWQNRVLEVLGVTDPNAWILYDRDDTRDNRGEIVRTRITPYIISCEHLLNFDAYAGITKWIIYRQVRIETYIDNGFQRTQMLEDFYMSAPGFILKMREIGETTTEMPGEARVDLEVFPVAPKIDPMQPEYAAFPIVVGAKKVRSFYFSSIQNGTTEVPAMCVGVYADESSDNNIPVFNTWFWPADGVIQGIIRDTNLQSVLSVTYAFPKQYEYTKACRFEDDERGACVGGYLGDIRTSDHICPSCNGSGRMATFTTEQEVLQLPMPGADAEMVELSKLRFTEPIDISLLEHISARIENAERRVMAAVFDSGLYQKPGDTKTRTATEVNAVLDGISDVLAPFAAILSRHFELVYRLAGQYMQFPITVDHAYPEDLAIESMGDILAQLKDAREAGAGQDVISAIRLRLIQKTYEGAPEKQKTTATKYNWLPFDDKTAEEVSIILTSRAADDPDRVLYENWLLIFREIENEHPKFPEYTFERQKQVVAEKVEMTRQRIIAAGADTSQDLKLDQNNNLERIDANTDDAAIV